MKILVTGGAGFIGSHLAGDLLGSGHTVVVLDNLSTGSADNIAPFRVHPEFTFMRGSICDRDLVEKAARGCDCICHLAAAVGVRLIVSRPVHTLETNITGFDTVLKVAAEHGIRVLLASSSEVYGCSDRIPMSEEDNSVIGTASKRRWSYACSKMMDEFLGLAYWHENRVPVVICRFFNIIGPRQTGKYGMVVPRFITQALSNEPLTVYGDGEQTRCFLNVRDLLRAVTALMECEAAAGGIYNIGSDSEISMNALARTVLQVTGSRSDIVYVPFEDVYGADFEDMRRRVPDIRKIRNLTGFKVRTGLEQTIGEIADHIRGGGRT